MLHDGVTRYMAGNRGVSFEYESMAVLEIVGVLSTGAAAMKLKLVDETNGVETAYELTTANADNAATQFFVGCY